MTAKEFFEYCKSKGWENKKIYIQYRDNGGIYLGCDLLGEDFEIYLNDGGNVII